MMCLICLSLPSSLSSLMTETVHFVPLFQSLGYLLCIQHILNTEYTQYLFLWVLMNL